MILNNINRNQWFIIILALVFVIPACKQKSIKGKEFIPRETFVDVLTDLHLIDGITNDMRYYRKYNPNDSIDLYTAIFEKHQITKEKYKRTLDEYSKHPNLLDKVYDEVLMNLNQMEDAIDQEEMAKRKEIVDDTEIKKESKKKKKDR